MPNIRKFAAMENRDTPPVSGPNTPEPQVPKDPPAEAAVNFTTPTSITSMSPRPTPQTSITQASKNRTQDHVEAGPQLKRRQQDLLVLTSLNDNSTLHWRPSWFKQDPFNKTFWTLHNPPNVVTEKLPSTVPQSKDYYTRRIRRDSDRPPLYIRSWDHWDRYCGLYGVPLDFLSEDQINLMRMGLPRNENGVLCAPPTYPLYPEPQPLSCGRYILDHSTYATHLPPKFRSVNHNAASLEDIEAVVVHSDGALTVERRDEMSKDYIQWTYHGGKGEHRDDAVYATDGGAPKPQGPARRWSYVPRTSAQEESCKPPSLVVKLKVNLKRKFGEDSGDGSSGVVLGTEGKDPKKKKANRMLRELQ